MANTASISLVEHVLHIPAGLNKLPAVPAWLARGGHSHHHHLDYRWMTSHIAMVRNMAHHEMVDRVLWGAGAFAGIPSTHPTTVAVEELGVRARCRVGHLRFLRLALLSTPFRSIHFFTSWVYLSLPSTSQVKANSRSKASALSS